MSVKGVIGLILAAGKGTRMRSRLPKVLHPLLGVPLLARVVDLLNGAGIEDVVVVIGHGAEKVRQAFRGSSVSFVVQKEQLGTGHAVRIAEENVRAEGTDVIIMCGDTPLFLPETIREFLKLHRESSSQVSILSAKFRNPFGYGRIIRDIRGRFERIVEEKDASEKEKMVSEVNTGTYLVDSEVLFQLVRRIGCNNAQREFYLTDIVELAKVAGYSVNVYDLASEEEALGVNSRSQLAVAEAVLLTRLREALMSKGVTLSMPHTIYVEDGVRVGKDSTISSHCVLRGKTRIGPNSNIGPFCYLFDAIVPEGTKLAPYSRIEGPYESKK